MKSIFTILFLFITLCSCNETRTEIKHSSFAEIEDFFQIHKENNKMNIVRIDVENYYLSEFKKYQPNNIDLESQSFEASYNLILKRKNSYLKSKAELTSTDNINWRIKKLTVVEEADSIGNHYEKTMVWEYPESLENYNVVLKIHN